MLFIPAKATIRDELDVEASPHNYFRLAQAFQHPCHLDSRNAIPEAVSSLYLPGARAFEPITGAKF